MSSSSTLQSPSFSEHGSFRMSNTADTQLTGNSMSSDQASKTQRQRQAWADDVRLKAELNIFTMEYSDASISDQRKREMLSQALEKGYISQAEAARYEQLLNGGASKISEAKFCNEESSVQSGPKTEVKAEPSPPGSKVGKKTSSCTLL